MVINVWSEERQTERPLCHQFVRFFQFFNFYARVFVLRDKNTRVFFLSLTSNQNHLSHIVSLNRRGKKHNREEGEKEEDKEEDKEEER